MAEKDIASDDEEFVSEFELQEKEREARARRFRRLADDVPYSKAMRFPQEKEDEEEKEEDNEEEEVARRQVQRVHISPPSGIKAGGGEDRRSRSDEDVKFFSGVSSRGKKHSDTRSLYENSKSVRPPRRFAQDGDSDDEEEEKEENEHHD